MEKRHIYLLAVLLLIAGSVQAQSVKKLLKAVTGITSQDFIGTWDYEGAAVNFKTNNLLKKAGGSVAASKLENELDERLSKLGFKPGVTTFVFNEDETFSNVTDGKTVKGTYSYDKSTGYITLNYINHIPVKAKVTGTSGKISLLFEADSFLTLVTFVGSNSGISVIKNVTSLLQSYDGMMVGIELKKL